MEFKVSHGMCLILLLCVNLVACSEKDLEFISSNSNSISGKFEIPSGTTSFSVNAQACSTYNISVYEADSKGFKSGNSLATTQTDASNSFKFSSLKDLGIDLRRSGLSYVIEAQTCTGAIYYRPIVGSNKAQNISLAADLIQKALQVASLHGLNVLNVNRTALSDFNEKLESLNADGFLTLYNAITANSSLKANFISLFGIDPSLLTDSLPVVAPPSTVPRDQNEGLSVSASTQAEHWHAGYQIVYQWNLDDTEISTAATLNHTLGKNTQGLRNLRLQVGKDNGSGAIDTTAPVFIKNYQVLIANTYPATAPSLSLVSPTGSYIGSRSPTLGIATGAGMSECESFSNLAITENDILPPLSAASYTITCSSAGTQDFIMPLTSSGDGAKVLRLWARDSAGNTSLVASSLTINLDEADPTVTLSNLSGPYKGGDEVSVSYLTTDGSGISSAKLQYAANGTSFVDVTTLDPSLTSYDWTLPLDTTSVAKIRLIGVDNSGRSVTVTSSAFEIDSTAPDALTITRTSSALSKIADVDMTVSGCTGDAVQMLFSESSSTPLVSDSNWQACAANKTYTVTGDGDKSIYAFAKDAVGNISAASSAVTMTLDQSGPALSFVTDLTDAAFKGGSVQSITWTSTDAHMGASTISLEYSTDDGGSWISIGAALPNFTYSWTLPSVDSSQMKLKVTASDSLGNTNSVVSPIFTIAITPPVIGNFQINGGATTTTSAYVSVALAATSLVANTTEFCLKTTAPTPDLTDSCWHALNLPQPNVTPSLNISFSNYQHLISFIPSAYTIYAWVRDAAGNISNSSSASITVQSPTPPSVRNIIVANTSTPSDPIISVEKNFNGSQSAYIKWKVTAASTASISLSYKVEAGTIIQIASGLNNGSNSGCVVNDTGTADDQATGCYIFNNAPSEYFKVTVKATDMDNISSQSTSYPLNAPEIEFLAGNTDLGLGTSALSSVLKIGSSWSDTGTIVVTTNGRIFMRDRSLGLVMVNPADGILQRVMPITGTASGDGGPVSNATLCAGQKIALDFQDRVLIFDCTKIRRINTAVNPMTIETIIGGGSLQADGTNALDFQIIEPGEEVSKKVPFFALPNGNIYFKAGNYSTSINDGNVIRMYKAADEKVYTITPSGVGHSEDPAVDISTQILDGSCGAFGVTYNPVNSQISRALFTIFKTYVGDFGCPYANLDPATFVSTAPHPTKSDRSDYYIQGMNGKLYVHDSRNGIFRGFDEATNSFTTLVGGGTDVECADGVLATSCKVNSGYSGFDAFVSASGQIYFVNHIGIVRTVLADGTVLRLMGQSKGEGDNLLAIDARANTVDWVDQANDGTIFFSDTVEGRIRKFNINGNITAHAANASSSASVMLLNPATKEIYGRSDSNNAYKLPFATATWESMGSLDTTYNSEGQVARELFGYDGSSSLAYILGPAWDETLGYRDFKMGTFNISTTGIDVLTNYTGGSTSSYCASGTLASTCSVPWTGTNARAQYDTLPTTPRWILLDAGSNRVVALNKDGQNNNEVLLGVATLPRNANSFVYRKVGGTEILDYCATDGKLYSYNITTGIDSAYNWPITSLTCDGRTLNYNSARDSLIFPARENGLSAIIEYKLNP